MGLFKYIHFKGVRNTCFFKTIKRRERNFPPLSVIIDIGRMVANVFIQRRYKNFAFFRNKEFIWPLERAKGFQQEIEKVSGNYYYFESKDLNETHTA